MTPPNKPAKPKVDALATSSSGKEQWKSFSGSRVDLQKIDTVQKREVSGFNIASYASAARARQAATTVTGDDALTAFRLDGKWDAPGILSAFVAGLGGDRRRPMRREVEPEGLLSAVRADVAAAIMGEAKGVRSLAATLARSKALDIDQQRKVDGAARAAGTRNLTVDHLRLLVEHLLIAAGTREDALVERAARLVDLRDNVREIGERGRNLVAPRQLLDIRAGEACLVVVDMPVREPSMRGRSALFSRVVVLLRDVKNELNLIDPVGLFDPAKGSDDTSAYVATMRKPDEMALRDFLAGKPGLPPLSPIARLAWNGYLASAPPKSLAAVEISVLRGSVFRYG
ncbi:MAG: hypothetical protein JXR83_16325 [Deltaproteobacteria bacterium]|nr:hypothetical protein [Deltaproteobacteria bacterium]